MKFKRQEVLNDTQTIWLYIHKNSPSDSDFHVAVSSWYQLSVQQLSKADQILDIIRTGLKQKKTKAPQRCTGVFMTL